MKRTLASVAVLLAVAGCGSTKQAASNSPSASPSTAPVLVNALGPTSTPIPRLAGYQGLGDWTFRVTSSQGRFTPGAGPGNVAWPPSQGHCSDQWYLLRWHALTPQAPIVAGFGSADTVTSKAAPATSGWLSIDGCQVPKWEGAGTISVDAQIYQPTS